MDFGKRMRELRKQKKVKVEKMADYMGVTVPTIIRWENGSIGLSASTIEKFCVSLGITLVDFFSSNGSNGKLNIPENIFKLVKDENNWAILDEIIAKQKKGWTNELITEWLKSLDNLMEQVKNEYRNAILMDVKGEVYDKEEAQKEVDKFNEKLKNGFIPPWEK
ncbi:MAG: Helix-turn-helix domain protein [Pelotomaculum sp. PtaB.Bin104]|nr:MAG: Helix-turn-helix domain protein [Pelotomaculum sp. PtaB.Bin104]